MNAWRSKEHWTFAKQWSALFDNILPKHVCEAALATCNFTLQGPNSVGDVKKNWGQWIRMRMQTFGHLPVGIGTVQQNHHWISTDSKEAANGILDCFGLTLEDVFDHYGTPAEGEKLQVDLYSVVKNLVPWMSDEQVETQTPVAVDAA